MEVFGLNMPHLVQDPLHRGRQISCLSYIPTGHFLEMAYIPGFPHKPHPLEALDCKGVATLPPSRNDKAGSAFHNDSGHDQTCFLPLHEEPQNKD